MSCTYRGPSKTAHLLISNNYSQIWSCDVTQTFGNKKSITEQLALNYDTIIYRK